MKTTTTDLRIHLSEYLDRVLETGEPLEIERKGGTVRIVAQTPVSRLSRLPRRDIIVGDPDDIVSIDWSGEWVAEDAT